MKLFSAIAGAAALVLLPLYAGAQSAGSYPASPSAQTTNTGPVRTYHPSTDNGSSWNHGEIGAYADYFRLSAPTPEANYVGVGGRLTLNVTPHFAMEGEMNYDFARNFTTTNSSNAGGSIGTSFVKTQVRPLTGLFGPRIQVGTSGPFRAFVTGKLGFINFSTSSSATNVNSSTFTSAVRGVGGGGTHFAVYPGGGVEAFFGPIGLRLDVGDEIYLNNGTYNNLRVTLGPVFRF